jgi:uncharacterized membrane protein YdjX (TVP38/TMEM64 family)
MTPEDGRVAESAPIRPTASLRSGTITRIKVVLTAVAIVAAIALIPKLRSLENSGLVELSEMGAFAPLALILAYVLLSSFLLPVFFLDMAAGAHFGFAEGVMWVQVAAAGGSIAGYALGRGLLSRHVERLLVWKPSLRRVDHAVAKEGWKIVFLTRLSPVFSFSLLNGFYGAARVPFVPYLLATIAGILPGTALYVYAGVMAGDLSGAPGHPEPSGTTWVVEILGFAATAAVVVMVTRTAQRMLGAKLEGGDEDDELVRGS